MRGWIIRERARARAEEIEGEAVRNAREFCIHSCMRDQRLAGPSSRLVVCRSDVIERSFLEQLRARSLPIQVLDNIGKKNVGRKNVERARTRCTRRDI